MENITVPAVAAAVINISECVRSNSHVIVRVDVSRSGMSRTMRFLTVSDDCQGVVNITKTIALILGGKTVKDNSIRIYGGGMDMVYHTLYQCALKAGANRDDASRWASNYTVV